MFAGEVYDYAGIFLMRWAVLIEIEQARNELDGLSVRA